MKWIIGLTAGLVLLAAVEQSRASDHVGIYAIVEDATIYSKGTPDEAIKIVGVFSLSEGRRDYKTPVYGYMYFRLQKGKETQCRNEFLDLVKVAAKPQVIAFSSRYKPRSREANSHGRIRKLTEKLAKPDEYPVHFGIQKGRGRSTTYLPVRRLRRFTRPASPSDGHMVTPGPVTLSVHNVIEQEDEKAVTYFFEIEDSTGKKESSPAIKQGEKKTFWTPKMQVKAGDTYTWRAWSVAPLKDYRTGKTNDHKGVVSACRLVGKKK